MNSLLILVPVSIALFGAAIGLFVWAVRRGQFDDLETPALDILTDENAAESPSSKLRDKDGEDGRKPPSPARAG